MLFTSLATLIVYSIKKVLETYWCSSSIACDIIIPFDIQTSGIDLASIILCETLQVLRERSNDIASFMEHSAYRVFKMYNVLVSEKLSRKFRKILRSSQRRRSLTKGVQEHLFLLSTSVGCFWMFRNTFFVKHLRTAAYWKIF